MTKLEELDMFLTEKRGKYTLDRDEALAAAKLDNEAAYRQGVEDATKSGKDLFAEHHLKNFSHLPGCGDGACVVAKPSGMQTNGGCQCLKAIPDKGFRQLVARIFAVLEIRQRLERMKGTDNG